MNIKGLMAAGVVALGVFVSATPASAAPTKTVAGLSIQITSFGPQGTNVEVGFQATNNTSREQRFWWPRFVLQAPNGTRRTAYRMAGTAPYQFVDAHGGFFADGGIFYFHRYQPGRYVIRYAGKVLQRKTL